jgi:hypothetical protein
MDSLGRPGEVKLAGHRNEVLQLPQLHPSNLSRMAIGLIDFGRWTRSVFGCCVEGSSR